MFSCLSSYPKKHLKPFFQFPNTTSESQPYRELQSFSLDQRERDSFLNNLPTQVGNECYKNAELTGSSLEWFVISLHSAAVFLSWLLKGQSSEAVNH